MDSQWLSGKRKIFFGNGTKDSKSAKKIAGRARKNLN